MLLKLLVGLGSLAVLIGTIVYGFVLGSVGFLTGDVLLVGLALGAVTIKLLRDVLREATKP